MKVRISRFPPHQNAKVLAVLMGVSSLMFAVPMFLLFSFLPMAEGETRPSPFMFLALPVMYLVMGYLMVAVGCVIYNVVTRYTGGLEYETDGSEQ